MKILQLSDIHISSPHDKPHGVDVRKNMQNCLQAAMNRGVDLLVITGDLCLQDGDPEIYQWLKEILEDLPIAWRVIAGNHDCSTLMADIFSLSRYYHTAQKELYWKERWQKHDLYFLDTSQGDVSDTQLAWLQRNLVQTAQTTQTAQTAQAKLLTPTPSLTQATHPPLIFMHHPPVKLSVPLMDDRNFPAPDSTRFLAVLKESSVKPHVFVGHYHVDKVAIMNEANIWACPSTFYQMCQMSQNFAIEHRRAGYRMIELTANGCVLSGTHYLDHT